MAHITLFMRKETRCIDMEQFPWGSGEWKKHGAEQVLIYNRPLGKDKKETDKRYLPWERGTGSLSVGRVKENLSLESQHSKYRNLGFQVSFSFHTALPSSSILCDFSGKCSRQICIRVPPTHSVKWSLKTYHITPLAKIPLFLFISIHIVEYFLKVWHTWGEHAS